MTKAENDELDLLAIQAKQGNLLAREELATRIYPVAMVISRRFFEEWSTEHLTRRELAQECCYAFFLTGLGNYHPESGNVMAYFAGLCVWVGCKAKSASLAGKRGGFIDGRHCQMIRVDGMPDSDDAWETIGIQVLDRGQAQVDARDSVDAAEAASSATREQWRVMRLVYEKDMTYREAGEFLGLSERQVDNMLQRLQDNTPYEPRGKK